MRPPRKDLHGGVRPLCAGEARKRASEGVREDRDGDEEEDVCGLALHSDLTTHPNSGTAPTPPPSPSSLLGCGPALGFSVGQDSFKSCASRLFQSGREAAPLQGWPFQNKKARRGVEAV